MTQGTGGELVFVVAVSSFTERGFVGSASHHGEPVDLEFDDRDEGVYLTPDMAKALSVRKGSKLLLVVEAEDEPIVTEALLTGMGPRPRISIAKVYYEVGKEGGAILKVRRA